MRGHLAAVFSVTSTCTSHRVWSTTHFLLEELHNWSARPVRTANGSQPHPTQMKTAICFGPGQCQKSRNNRSHTRLQLMLACGDFFCFMGDKNMQQPEWSLHISEQKAPRCIAHLAFFAHYCSKTVLVRQPIKLFSIIINHVNMFEHSGIECFQDNCAFELTV